MDSDLYTGFEKFVLLHIDLCANYYKTTINDIIEDKHVRQR